MHSNWVCVLMLTMLSSLYWKRLSLASPVNVMSVPHPDYHSQYIKINKQTLDWRMAWRDASSRTFFYKTRADSSPLHERLLRFFTNVFLTWWSNVASKHSPSQLLKVIKNIPKIGDRNKDCTGGAIPIFEFVCLGERQK